MVHGLNYTIGKPWSFISPMKIYSNREPLEVLKNNNLFLFYHIFLNQAQKQITFETHNMSG